MPFNPPRSALQVVMALMGCDPIGRVAQYNILKPELLALKQRASSSVGTVYSYLARFGIPVTGGSRIDIVTSARGASRFSSSCHSAASVNYQSKVLGGTSDVWVSDKAFRSSLIIGTKAGHGVSTNRTI